MNASHLAIRLIFLVGLFWGRHLIVGKAPWCLLNQIITQYLKWIPEVYSTKQSMVISSFSEGTPCMNYHESGDVRIREHFQPIL